MKKHKTPEPVRAMTSIFVSLQVLLAATAVSDVLGQQVVGICLAVIAAIQIGVGEYVRNRVTPIRS